MKLTTEHYNNLKLMIECIVEQLPVSVSVAEENHGGLGKDPAKRFRWDLLYAIPFNTRINWFRDVYEYCNDTHIDTALRKIIKELKAV